MAPVMLPLTVEHISHVSPIDLFYATVCIPSYGSWRRRMVYEKPEYGEINAPAFIAE